MVHGAEDGFNHPQPPGCDRPLICGWEGRFGVFRGVWDACTKRNVKTSYPDPPPAAANLPTRSTSHTHAESRPIYDIAS
eukprot:3227899-Prymnesium_polylepis.1